MAIIQALAGTSSLELEDFVGAEFYCLHALAVLIVHKRGNLQGTLMSQQQPFNGRLSGQPG